MITFVVLFFAFAFFSSNLRIRYISPVIPPLVILSIFGCRKMTEAMRKFNSRSAQSIGLALIFVILSLAFWLNANYILNQYNYVDPFSYLNGTLSRDQYINKYRPEYPVMQFNKQEPFRGCQDIIYFYGLQRILLR